MTPGAKERKRALNCERTVSYRKRKKESLQQSHVNLAPVDAGTSAILLLLSMQEREQHAMPAQLYSDAAVQTQNAAAALQVAPLPPLHQPTMESHSEEESF